MTFREINWTKNTAFIISLWLQHEGLSGVVMRCSIRLLLWMSVWLSDGDFLVVLMAWVAKSHFNLWWFLSVIFWRYPAVLFSKYTFWTAIIIFVSWTQNVKLAYLSFLLTQLLSVLPEHNLMPNVQPLCRLYSKVDCISSQWPYLRLPAL